MTSNNLQQYIDSQVATISPFKLHSQELVPRSLCEPSDKLIREAVNAGVRDIPGVEIREEKGF